MPSSTYRISAAAVLALATAGVAVVAAPAGAATRAAHPDSGGSALKVDYTANGTSTVAKTNSTVKLGPATLKTSLAPTGKFTGSLVLPPTSTSFTAEGLIPITATVTFTEVGKLTGALVSNPKPHISSKTADLITLSNVTVAGLPAMVGNSCTTTAPVQISAATPKGQVFSIEKGGTVTATYTIGDFANCGLITTLINQMVPGPGNTLTLKLTNGRILNG